MNRVDLRLTNLRWPSNLLPAFTNLSCPWFFLLVGGTLSHMKGHSSGLYEPSTPVLLMSAKKIGPLILHPLWAIYSQNDMCADCSNRLDLASQIPPARVVRSPRPWSELMAMACMGCLEVMDTLRTLFGNIYLGISMQIAIPAASC